MKLSIDRGANVLYMSIRYSELVICLEDSGHVLTRIDPKSREVVGFTILDYLFSVDYNKITFPFVEDIGIVETLRKILWDAYYPLEGDDEIEVEFDMHIPFTEEMRKALHLNKEKDIK